jgi:N-acyl homoserine lactone hydrolase
MKCNQNVFVICSHVSWLNFVMKIHALSTGQVKIKQNAVRGKGFGAMRMVNVLLDSEWTDWLPIHVWLLEHSDGLIVVDTGERHDAPILPVVKLQVKPETDLVFQLKNLGINPEKDVQCVIQTHLHGDHVGGIGAFGKIPILVSKLEWQGMQGVSGWLTRQIAKVTVPARIKPSIIEFSSTPFGLFEQSCPVTKDGAVKIVPTPGHTNGHVSVIAQSEGISYFLAGDTSYSQTAMLERVPSGFSSNDKLELETHTKIRAFAQQNPTVYLPSHDPESAIRLEQKRVVQVT